MACQETRCIAFVVPVFLQVVIKTFIRFGIHDTESRLQVRNMSIIETREVAKFMLESGRYHSAASIAKGMNIPIERASSKLYNIKRTPGKYQCKRIGGRGTMKYKVIAISKNGETPSSLSERSEQALNNFLYPSRTK